MKTILINITTNQPASKVFEGGYKVDGQRVSAEELAKQGLMEMEYIDTPRPELTSTKVASSEWQVTENGFERIWTVREKTAYDVACEDWMHMDYAIRIVAPISMLDPVNPNNDLFHKFYNWLLAQGLPMVKVGDNVQLYMNEILENHRAFVDSITQITVEDRPKIEDYE